MSASNPHPLAPARTLAVLLVALLVCGAEASAAVLVDTFDTGGGFSPTLSSVAAYGERAMGLYAERAAARFTVPAGDFTLSSITLPLARLTDFSLDVLRVRLTSDSAGAPGRTLETLSENQNIWPDDITPFSTPTTLTSAAHPELAGGSAYWIVTEITSVPHVGPGNDAYVYFQWFQNTHGSQVPVLLQYTELVFPSDPWPTGVTPEPLAFRVEGSSTLDVGTPTSGRSLLSLDAPRPNPATAGTYLQFRLGRRAAVSAEVFDLAGHRVRSLIESRELPVGEHGLDWNGHDASGQQVTAGVYWIRVSAGSTSESRRIAVMR